MILKREIAIEGKKSCVVLSDEREALLAAKAAGRVLVGILSGGDEDLSPARYLVETPECADERYLERVVRREMGLPWIIAESKRLILREFTMEDLAQIPGEGESEADRVFYTEELLKAYIRGQYGFYEYGMWAVVRREDGRIIGKAGVSDCDIRRVPAAASASAPDLDAVSAPGAAPVSVPGAAPALSAAPVPAADLSDASVSAPEMRLELGYHIFAPYRRQGYAEEACRMVLDYTTEEYGCPVYAVTEQSNLPSIRLLEKLGFRAEERKYNEAAPQHYLCWRYWR